MKVKTANILLFGLFLFASTGFAAPPSTTEEQITTLRKQVDDLNDLKEKILWGAGIVGATGVAGFLSLLKQARKKTEDSLAEQREAAAKELAKQLAGQNQLVAQVLQNADAEGRLIGESNILIVNQDGSLSEVWRELRALGFINLDVVAKAAYDDKVGRTYTSLVLEGFDEPGVTEFVGASTISGMLVYHPGNSMRLPAEVFARVTFANAKISLYDNIMRVLRYRRALDRAAGR